MPPAPPATSSIFSPTPSFCVGQTKNSLSSVPPRTIPTIYPFLSQSTPNLTKYVYFRS